MTVQNSTPKLDWDDARIFLAAYRAGSLMGAAQALGVSHSTIRRRLTGLERTIGAKLFTPTSEGLVPTDAAEVALGAAETIETSVLSFADRLSGNARDLRGSLIVTTVDGLAEIIAPSLTLYAEQYPNVAITFNTSNRFLDLARREADVAVRLTNTPDDRLFGRKIGEIMYAPFATRELVEAHGKDVAKIPWILWDRAAGAVGTESWYHQWSGGREPVARVTNAMALLSLARTGLGGAVLPVPLAMKTGLVALEAPLEGLATDLWCLCPMDLRRSERVRTFMDLLVSQGYF